MQTDKDSYKLMAERENQGNDFAWRGDTTVNMIYILYKISALQKEQTHRVTSCFVSFTPQMLGHRWDLWGLPLHQWLWHTSKAVSLVSIGRRGCQSFRRLPLWLQSLRDVKGLSCSLSHIITSRGVSNGHSCFESLQHSKPDFHGPPGRLGHATRGKPFSKPPETASKRLPAWHAEQWTPDWAPMGEQLSRRQPLVGVARAAGRKAGTGRPSAWGDHSSPFDGACGAPLAAHESSCGCMGHARVPQLVIHQPLFADGFLS